MKILGIDPGTATTGYGVIQTGPKASYTLIDYGLVETTKDQPRGARLKLIHTGISEIIAKHAPEVVAIERLFFATNALTAIAVGQVIGVILLAVQDHALPVFDYTPMQVKLYVGGHGKADKSVIKKQIWKLFHIKAKKGHQTHFDNSADALAIAVCHAIKSTTAAV